MKNNKHISVENLFALYRGELDLEQINHYMSHIEECEECSITFEAMKAFEDAELRQPSVEYAEKQLDEKLLNITKQHIEASQKNNYVKKLKCHFYDNGWRYLAAVAASLLLVSFFPFDEDSNTDALKAVASLTQKKPDNNSNLKKDGNCKIGDDDKYTWIWMIDTGIDLDFNNTNSKKAIACESDGGINPYYSLNYELDTNTNTVYAENGVITEADMVVIEQNFSLKDINIYPHDDTLIIDMSVLLEGSIDTTYGLGINTNLRESIALDEVYNDKENDISHVVDWVLVPLELKDSVVIACLDTGMIITHSGVWNDSNNGNGLTTQNGVNSQHSDNNGDVVISKFHFNNSTKDNNGETIAITDFSDMNGDRLPDLISLDPIQYKDKKVKRYLKKMERRLKKMKRKNKTQEKIGITHKAIVIDSSDSNFDFIILDDDFDITSLSTKRSDVSKFPDTILWTQRLSIEPSNNLVEDRNKYIIPYINDNLPSNKVKKTNEKHTKFCSNMSSNLNTQVSDREITGSRFSDSLNLVKFYESTNGENWINKWDLALPMDEWEGVTLDSNGRVSVLSLNNNNLTGKIPIELGLLDRLIIVTSAGNGIVDIDNPRDYWPAYYGTGSEDEVSDSIPFAYFPNLEKLDLSYNQLSGTIPNFSDLQKLIYLDLSYNQLSIDFSKTLYKGLLYFNCIGNRPKPFGED